MVGRGYREGTAIGLRRAGREAAVGRASLCYKNYVLKFDQEAEMAKRVHSLSRSLSNSRERALALKWLPKSWLLYNLLLWHFYSCFLAFFLFRFFLLYFFPVFFFVIFFYGAHASLAGTTGCVRV